MENGSHQNIKLVNEFHNAVNTNNYQYFMKFSFDLILWANDC